VWGRFEPAPHLAYFLNTQVENAVKQTEQDCRGKVKGGLQNLYRPAWTNDVAKLFAGI
jgi:hypothetical protein